MKTKLASLASALVLSAAIGVGGTAPAHAGCNDGSTGAKEIIGTIGGAAIGGLIGSQIGRGTGRGIAIGAGVFVGGVLGNQIGKSLDCADQRRHNQVTNTSLEKTPDNTTSTWQNPNTGASGSTTPTRTYQNASGTPCRDFNTTVTNGAGESHTGSGTACRNSQGGWEIN